MAVDFFTGGVISIDNLISPNLAFAVGSAGTDFGISAASNTITFNIPTVSATARGLVPASGGGTSNFLRADGTWAAPAGFSLGTYDSQSPDPHGLVFNGGLLYAQSASVNYPGMVSTGAQTFAGNKTFGAWTSQPSSKPVLSVGGSIMVHGDDDSDHGFDGYYAGSRLYGHTDASGNSTSNSGSGSFYMASGAETSSLSPALLSSGTTAVGSARSWIPAAGVPVGTNNFQVLGTMISGSFASPTDTALTIQVGSASGSAPQPLNITGAAGSSGNGSTITITGGYSDHGTSGPVNISSGATNTGSLAGVNLQVAGSNKFVIDGATGRPIIVSSNPPASAAAAGTSGMIAWDSGFIYVCTATNTWKRVAIASW